MSDSMETRRRSRSKTPFLRSACDHENCEIGLEDEHHHHHQQRKRAKTPNVRTIIEEEVTSSSSPHTIASVKKAKLLDVEKITSDYYSDDPSPDKKARKSLDAEFSIATPTAIPTATVANVQGITANRLETGNTTYSSSATTIVTHRVIKSAAEGLGRSALLSLGNRATSTPKANNMNYQSSFAAQYSDAAQYESKQNELNNTQERVRNSLNNSISNNRSQRNRLSFEQTQGLSRSNNSGSNSMKYVSNQEINPQEHLPYMEYRNAGEYWNVTPKTDYTYSELSPHRRELAPGVVAMPNMSRHSLGNYCERVYAMIQRNPQHEDSIRRRYNANTYAERQEFSDDQLDYKYMQQTQISWWRRFISSFLSIFTSIYSFVSGGKPNDSGVYEEAYYRKYYGHTQLAPKGFFGTIYSGFMRGYSYLYTALTRLIQLDMSLLRSDQSTQSSRRRSVFWLLLLLLLPWLLIGGYYKYLNPNENFLPKSISQLLTLPLTSSNKFAMPNIDLSDYVNEQKYIEFQQNVQNSWTELSAWSNDYILYLKTISQKIIDEIIPVAEKSVDTSYASCSTSCH